MKYLNFLKNIFFVLLGIFVLAEFLFLISPKIIDANSHKKEINELLKNFIDTEFTFDELHFKTYPDFSIKVDAHNAKLKNLADIERLNLKLGLAKLIFGKISVKKFDAYKSNLKITIFNDGLTNLDKILLTLPFEVELKNSVNKISYYKLLINDEKTGQKIDIAGDYINAKISKNEINAEIKGEINSLNENAKIDLKFLMPLPDIKTKLKDKSKYFIITGYIKNLHPEIFEELIKTYVSKDLQDIEGVINAEFVPEYNNRELKNINIQVDIDNFKILSKKRENSVIFEGKNKIISNITVDKKDLKVNNFEFSSNDYKISANGIIEKFKTKKPKIDFDINIDNSSINKIYWMLPSNLFTVNEEIRKIKRYGVYGIADGNIKLKGNMLKPEIYGKVDYKDVWILDGLPENVQKAVIKTNFRKDIVDVDVKVWASEKEYVTVVGYSDFFDLSNNEYQINSTDNVPLEVAQKMLPPISDVLGFMIGPVPIMDIKGVGNIDLNTRGSQENPILNGYFTFKNASAAFNDINIIKLENSSGRIDFKKDKVYFKNDTGTILNRPVKISGVSDIKIDIDYDVKVDNISIKELLTALKTSPMLKDYAKQVEIINNAKGVGDIILNLKGHIYDPKDITNPNVIKFIKPKGIFTLKNTTLDIDNLNISLNNTNGSIKIDDNKIDMDIYSNLFTSPISIKGTVLDNKANININSEKMKLIDSTKLIIGFFSDKINTLNDISKTTIFSMNLNYKGPVEKIDLNNVDLKAIFKNQKKSISKIDILSGALFFKNGNLKLNNINTKFYNTTAYINGKIENLFKKPLISMDFSLYKFDLSILNNIKKASFIPEKYKKILNAYKNYKGVISSNINIINNNINGNIWLRDVEFSHSILDYPFWINSADFNLKNSNLEINSFNASFAGTPIFINGVIDNFIRNPKYNVNFSSKLSKDFVDNYINTNLSYPINVKGEILLSFQIFGTKDSVNILPSIKLEQDADISYMGANLGEENLIREIKANIQKTKNKLYIKNLDYSKYIYSQNNVLYPLPMMNIKALISKDKGKMFMNYINIKTNNPIGANIVNAILKKSLIKGGNISCDLNIEGYFDKPKIRGNAIFKNVNIPLYETYIDNIKIDFNQKYIDVNTKINYLDSDVNVIAKIKNNRFDKIFIDNIDIYSQKTDLNKLLKLLNEISYKNPIQIVSKNKTQNNTSEQIPIDLKKLIIEKGTIKADKMA